MNAHGNYKKINPRFLGRGWLSDQGSNLDSSEPKPDVLPVTPSDSSQNFGIAKVKKKMQNPNFFVR